MKAIPLWDKNFPCHPCAVVINRKNCEGRVLLYSNTISTSFKISTVPVLRGVQSKCVKLELAKQARTILKTLHKIVNV